MKQDNEFLNKLSPHVIELWSEQDYRAYLLLQIGLWLSGVQSAQRTAEICRITQTDVRILSVLIRNIIPETEEGTK